jgi:hypothetical protein
VEDILWDRMKFCGCGALSIFYCRRMPRCPGELCGAERSHHRSSAFGDTICHRERKGVRPVIRRRRSDVRHHLGIRPYFQLSGPQLHSRLHPPSVMGLELFEFTASLMAETGLVLQILQKGYLTVAPWFAEL